MACFRKTRVVGCAVWAVVLGLVCETTLGREAKLVIYPQKVSGEAGKYSLLPPAASLTDADAVPLYEKAVKALPGKASYQQIQQWLKLPPEELPAEQVEKALAQYVQSFKFAAQAVRCRRCNWPAWKPGTQVANLDEYRWLAQGIRLWARFEISNGEYEGALMALQTGFGMGRQLVQAPTLIQLQTGVANTNALCREIEPLVQMEDAPNLYLALAGLPKPFADAEKAIDSETKAASSDGPTGSLVSKQLEGVMKPVHDRTRALAKKLDSDLALLQGVEAIRSYVASHQGQLPPALAELKEFTIPQDPMCGAAFRYTRTGATAVLESTVPAGGEKRDELRYEITVKN